MTDGRFYPVDPDFAAGDLASNIQAILRVAVLAADNGTANVAPETKIVALEMTVEVASVMMDDLIDRIEALEMERRRDERRPAA